MVYIWIFVPLLPNELLPMKESAGERFALYCPAGYYIRGYQGEDIRHTSYLQEFVLQVSIG